jgi:hypothetical protein
MKTSFFKYLICFIIIISLSSCFTCRLYDSKINYDSFGNTSLSGCIECKGNVNDIKNFTKFKIVK